MSNPIRIFGLLIKYRVSATVALTTVPGYLVYTHHFKWEILFILAGVYCFASAATALNQVQDRKEDALMERTKGRPLPMGNISVQQAIIIVIVLSIAGSILLFYFAGWIALLLGILNIFIYNAMYTYLKHYTPFAILPGSIIGMIPLFIGWSAAGGNLLTKEIWILGFFLLIWQIPHFWLLHVIYSNDYKKAGFPVLYDYLSPRLTEIITSAWMLATSASAIILALSGTIRTLTGWIITSLVSLIIGGMSLFNLIGQSILTKKRIFIILNLAMVIIMMVVIIENI